MNFDSGTIASWYGYSKTISERRFRPRVGVRRPPNGGRTKAHLHENHETALYLISGDEVELWTGEQLEHREVARAGDYIYIPAGVPHVAVNRTETHAAFLAARTDPNEQESVVMRPDLEDKVP
jgi:uncharacterized RmlC-like cupin family protein